METIVAFLVLLILLTTVTTAVRAAIALNNRAIERSTQLEATCAQIELNQGSDVNAGASYKLVLSFGTSMGINPIEIPILVKTADPLKLQYFIGK
ncbi:MAG: hypothetical protein RRZ24_08975 [Clostridia bacterium]